MFINLILAYKGGMCYIIYVREITSNSINIHTEIFMNNQQTFCVVNRDGINILIGSETTKHILMHNSVGAGSMWKEGFCFAEDTLPQKPVPFWNVVQCQSTVGYLLVDKIEQASLLPDAVVGEDGTKEGLFDGKPRKFSVPSVKTSMPLNYFSTNEYTVGLFPYSDDPQFCPPERKAFVEQNGLNDGNLLVLGTAFPGQVSVRGQAVPVASLDGGKKWHNEGWCVIIPS